MFEVVNDNNDFQNFGVFSTNFFGYNKYVGEGPCGGACDVAQLGPEVDLIDEGDNVEAAQGAVARLLPVRVVSHHMRLLGVLHRSEDSDTLVLVDYDDN